MDSFSLKLLTSQLWLTTTSGCGLLHLLHLLHLLGQPLPVASKSLCLALQDVITRVQSLEQVGQLSGVMDDRGKVQCLHQC